MLHKPNDDIFHGSVALQQSDHACNSDDFASPHDMRTLQIHHRFVLKGHNRRFAGYVRNDLQKVSR